MSYILEALKKSEQARQRGAAGSPYSLLPAACEEVLPQRVGHYALLAGLLLLNAFIMLPWLRQLPLRPAPAAAAPTSARAANTAPAAELTALPAPPIPMQVIPPAPRVRTVIAPSLAMAPPVAAPPKVAERPAKVRNAPAPTPSPPPAQASTPKPAQEAPTDGSIPEDIRKQIPPLTVSGYIHNAGSNPMVIVNDKLLHEGDEAAPGLRLEKIAGDGLVFSFKGYRFKR